LDRHHDIQRTIDLNFLGPSRLVLGLIPTLVNSGGHVINISALNVLLTPAPRWAAYQASKTAFDQWMRSVAPELRAKGVKTTTIYLPLVRTRMIEPTKAYDKAPALSPEDAASLICRAIVSQRRMYGPWWLLPAQLGSILLRTPIEAMMSRLAKLASNPAGNHND
jgi:short-subunit dehydrogenase